MHHKILVGNTNEDAGDNYTAHMVFLKQGDTDYIHENGEWMHFDEHSDIIIMQWTGLRDKNLTKIYEGDVVKYYGEFGFTIGHVAFINSAFYVVSTTDISIVVGDVKKDYIEVIGNIYQHPELINKTI